MNRCTNCGKYPFCNEIIDPLVSCKNWSKRKLEDKEDKNFSFERLENGD